MLRSYLSVRGVSPTCIPFSRSIPPRFTGLPFSSSLPFRPRNWRHRAHVGGTCAWQQGRPSIRCTSQSSTSVHQATHKASLEQEMAKTYDPVDVESGWYQWWEKKGLFKRDSPHETVTSTSPSPRQPFSVLLPPPNVTGYLHIGHALTAALQDSMVRWRRMCGDRVEWIPGTDHAGISTQVVVEKMLMRERGLTRHDLKREEFIAEVWKWKEKHGGRITDQLRRMGSSLDWSKEFFTMDAPRSDAVVEAFVRLHEDGLIYRDRRMVNWCPHLRTVISDIEVVNEQITTPTTLSAPSSTAPCEFGILHDFAYTLENGGGELIVSTTRPETIFGDTAVAVHPEDPRYRHMIGQTVVQPITGRRIKVVGDAILVDRELGSGAVKITPMHDQDDYSCGKRNHLEEITVIDDGGKMCNVPSAFEGVDRLDARAMVVSALEEAGAYRGRHAHEMRVLRCSRSGDIIEPRFLSQWFVHCAPLCEKAMDLVRQDDLGIVPAKYKDEWYRWLEVGQDWCVSRQLWWGHRIPAYRVVPTQESSHSSKWVVARSLAEAHDRVKEQHGLEDKQSYRLVQDEDVLDTWFSSALLPLSAQGWPTAEFEKSQKEMDTYPLNVMETGSDILFFWVARMVMMCPQFDVKKRQPFSKVWLHPMVRDSQGRKMSKSLGNVIDPEHVIDGVSLPVLVDGLAHGNLSESEQVVAASHMRTSFPDGIPQCGTDALRFALIDYTHQTRSINLDVQRVLASRHFCNKMWNATRFVFSSLEQQQQKSSGERKVESDRAPSGSSLLADRWILSRLEHTIAECDKSLTSMELSGATTALQSFFVNDFCDVYIEFSKQLFRSGEQSAAMLNRKSVTCHHLKFVLDRYFRLLHPFMPFVTEELWHRLKIMEDPSSSPLSLMASAYPRPASAAASSHIDECAERDMSTILRVVHATRSLRSRFLVPSSEKVTFHVVLTGKDEQVANHLGSLVSSELPYITGICNADAINVENGDDGAGGGAAVHVVDHRLSVGMALTSLSNLERNIKNVQKKCATTEKNREDVRKRLNNPKFLERAPEEVQDEMKGRMESSAGELLQLEAVLAQLLSAKNKE
eukprot:TRINITY_DN1092_c0_g2_i1.p1 TRINITY_DN1092_c0_g2~~TRINITY_DN1092_c0_g2_i1.p1  ORF type:complete len:1082 (+),score=218.17 TRINITY_DN1092_c0_g2_i1:301-3546(+)